MTDFAFATSTTIDSKTGEVISAYFRIRRGKVAETREFAEGAAFADYNRNGELLGIEVIAPCRVTVVDQLAANEPQQLRNRTKRFMRDSGPRMLIAA